MEGRTDERGTYVKREGSCIREALKSREVGFSVFKSLAEKRLLQLWFLRNRCVCICTCVYVCVCVRKNVHASCNFCTDKDANETLRNEATTPFRENQHVMRRENYMTPHLTFLLHCSAASALYL